MNRITSAIQNLMLHEFHVMNIFLITLANSWNRIECKEVTVRCPLRFLSLYGRFYRKYPVSSNFGGNTVPLNDTILPESLTSPLETLQDSRETS